jgi:hypothetical protein
MAQSGHRTPDREPLHEFDTAYWPKVCISKKVAAIQLPNTQMSRKCFIGANLSAGTSYNP